MVPRLKEKYDSEIGPALKEQLGFKNPHQFWNLEKIVINMGVGSAVGEKKHMEDSLSALTLISGQKPLRREGFGA